MEAVAALFIIAALVFLPLIGTFLLLLLPAPLAYTKLVRGGKAFVITAALCIAAVTFAGGFPAYTLVVVSFCVMAHMIGHSLRQGDPYPGAVAKGALAPAAVVWPLAGLYFLAVRQDPWTLLGRAFEAGIGQSMKLYGELGMSQADMDTMLPSLRMFARIVLDYLPSLYISLMAAVCLACYFMVREHAVRAGVLKRAGGPMKDWRAPDVFVWGVIAPGFLMVVPVHAVRLAAGNLLLVFATVYLFQGIAVAAYLSDRFKMTPLLKFIAFIVIALQPFLVVALLVAGLFDTWADFRKIRVKHQDGAA